ncbi:MAG: hypothetical protein ACK57B_11595 [Betaproteobacteria bacterium]
MLLAAGLAACGDHGGGGGEAAPALPPPPVITTQPQAQNVADGATANFAVTASGSGLSYQWQRGSTVIPGASGATLGLPAVGLADDGARFRVVVSNSGGSVTSSEALLTVTPVAPSIATGPAPATVTAGQTATFTAVAAGSAPLAYRWLRDGAEIAGATAASFTTATLALADDGARYAVRVTNAAGSVTSAAAVLTVQPAPVAPQITAQPQAATVTAGQTATFEVIATGTAPLAYQWRRNGTAIAGATSAGYTTPATTPSDSGAVFSVVVSNAAGNVTSAGAALSVLPAPQASGQARLVFGTGHVVALRADGRVLAWGLNNVGQLGGGAAIAGTNARDVPTTASAVAAGQFESLALGSDGLLRGWGRKFGSTTIIGGDAANTGTDVTTPATGGWPGGVTHVVTGTGNSFGFALRNDGTVWHMPGTATAIAGGFSQAARQVAGLPAVAALGGAVSNDPLAIGRDGSVWFIRVLSAGAGSWQASIAQVSGLSGIVAGRCQGFGCIALDSAGTVRDFALGGSSAPRVVAGLPVIVQVSSTGNSFLALDREGRVWQWNAGATPQQVVGIDNVVEVAGGLQTVLVRRVDGSVWGWGANTFGELGLSAPSSTTTPVQVQGINLN